MALRKILLNGDPALRKPARPVVKFNRRLHMLLDDLAQTMYDATGCGLAAPQVGILQRAVVIDLDEEGSELIELVNPEIIASEGEDEAIEGCLSIPDIRGHVTRPQKVKVRAQDRFGEFFELETEGLLARCVCHEIDHLQGCLYIDIMSRQATEEEIEAANDEKKQT
ncbi:MAG: peptide deformylase [Clostridia bacterium]|nr:peptide deformylase [Clostridia bacterium]